MSTPSPTNRFCPNCGKPVAMEAKFCPACGATIPQLAAPPVPQAPMQAPVPPVPSYPSYGPSYQTPYQQPSQQPKKSNTKIIIAVVIIVVVLVAGLGTYAAYTFFQNLPTSFTQKSLSIASGTYQIPAGKIYLFNFTLQPGTILITVNGTFTTTGTVRVYLVDHTNYVYYHTGQAFSNYYDSGSTASGTIVASLPTYGTYHLFYENTLGSLESVTTTANLYYR